MRSVARGRFVRIAAMACVASLAACGGQQGLGGSVPSGSSMQAGAQSLRGPLSPTRSALKLRSLVAKSGMGPDHGAGYPVTPYPPVKVPAEAPCVDQLFTPNTPPLQSGQLPVGDFSDYSDHPFNYAPPSGCPGPYNKIVFKMHFRVTAGVQFDRTGAVWIGGTNVFFGTTAEPGSSSSPQWNVERDVTDYAPIFANASTGQASVYNIVNSQYTGKIFGTAELDFYPATLEFPPAQTADAVYPLSASSTGGYVFLNAPSNQMTGTFTFPQNVEAAYLDLFLESQSGDEFWYTCFPNDLAQKLNNCGSTAFREGEVTIDGQPAGVAPVYPWIYTGGIDPYLWVPLPGAETLNFKPYRVNLTPFAAMLDDGNPHTVAVSVFNADGYFSANGALLIYEDHGSSHVTGGLIRNGTALDPAQTVVEHVKFTQSGDAHGTVDVSATHPVSLKGYVITSQGRVETEVTQRVAFSNAQVINDTATQFLQNIVQNTIVESHTVTTQPSGTQRSHSRWTYPLTLDYNYQVVGSSSATQTVSVDQNKRGDGLDEGIEPVSFIALDLVHSSDVLTFTASGYSPSNGKSSHQYATHNYDGRHCWEKTVKSRDYVVTNTTQSCQ